MSFTTPFFSIYGFLNLYTYTITLPTKHCESIKYKLSRDALNERCIYHFKYSFLRPPVNRNEHNQIIEKYYYFVLKKSKIWLVIIFETAPKKEPHFCLFFSSLHLKRKHFQYYYNKMNLLILNLWHIDSFFLKMSFKNMKYYHIRHHNPIM